jgi:hypothetical protein
MELVLNSGGILLFEALGCSGKIFSGLPFGLIIELS